MFAITRLIVYYYQGILQGLLLFDLEELYNNKNML